MLGERLSDLRKDRGLTQDQLAQLLHMSNHNISAYECGKNEPPDSAKIAFARFFDVSVDYLVGLTDSPNAGRRPDNYILLDKDFPPAAKVMVQSLVRMISVAAKSRPQTVSKELERVTQAFLSVISDSEHPDS